jgi:3-methyl-2-oxobutanoate hydroxymethyltransferase
MAGESVFERRPDRRVTVQDVLDAKRAGERWAMLTAYDQLMAGLFEAAGIPVLLVGDSAGMVVFGDDTTLAVGMHQLLPLVEAVVRGTRRALVVADLPFGSYQASPEQALRSATKFLKEGGAQAVKLEGGAAVVRQVEALVAAGIPVMGHVGLTPQHVHAFGGFRVQGRGDAAERVLTDARQVEAAGAFAIVLEAIPAELGRRITEALSIPTIGIGAGPDCSAQVLVWQDMLGLTPDPAPKFAKRYANFREIARDAVQTFAEEVKSGRFPSPEHSYR